MTSVLLQEAGRRRVRSGGGLTRPAAGLQAGHEFKYSSVRSPLQFPSQSCPSPPLLTRNTSPPDSAAPRQRTRKGSSSSTKRSNPLLKKSSLVCQKTEYPQLSSAVSSPSPEAQQSVTNNLQEISITKKDNSSNFAKSCKITEIYRSGLNSSSQKKK